MQMGHRITCQRHRQKNACKRQTRTDSTNADGSHLKFPWGEEAAKPQRPTKTLRIGSLIRTLVMSCLYISKHTRKICHPPRFPTTLQTSDTEWRTDQTCCVNMLLKATETGWHRSGYPKIHHKQHI